MTPKEIAAKLTPAQRRALLYAPADCLWMGRDNIKGYKQSFAAMDRADLGKPQLCEVRVDAGGICDARLTPLGLQVRKHLETSHG